MRQHLPSKDFFIGRTLPAPDNLTLTAYKDGGGNALVYLAEDTTQARRFACKIIPRANVSPEWQQEIFKSNVVDSSIPVKVLFSSNWTVDGFEGVYLLSEYIEGPSIDKILRSKNPSIITIPFIKKFLEEMLSFLNSMKDKNVIHGDLHCGNILLKITKDISGEEIYSFKVIDFGTALIGSDFVFKDDYIQMAINLRRLLSVIDYQNSLDSKSKFLYNVFNDFFTKALHDIDPSINKMAKNPVAMYQHLASLSDTYQRQLSTRDNRVLLSPFDFLSCEQIGESHSILNALYSNLFLGLDEIENRSNIVLTGPRGCGKSTVFKCLSVRHRILADTLVLDDIHYMGIYYRCDDLWVNFQRYESASKEDIDIPTEYISATLGSELLADIQAFFKKFYKDEFDKKEKIIASSISGLLDVVNLFSLDDIITHLNVLRRRTLAQYKFKSDENWHQKGHLAINFIQEVCNILCSNLTPLIRRPIYFFIDDYSSPKVTLDLQENLNRIFMQRASYCFFKISTESPVSFSQKDVDGKVYVENREFKLINLAVSFSSADDKAILAFIEDVFLRRFNAVPNYPVANLSELLGQNHIIQNELAKDIRDRNYTKIWGVETLGKLCSGDIFYIISLVERMVSLAGGAQYIAGSDIPRVTPKLQLKAIKEEAGVFLKNLESATENGKQLVAVVNAFGYAANYYLLHKNSKNEEGNPIHQANRIEPLEALALSPESNPIFKELLRYSLFFLDYRGKSQRGDIVPRLLLRRCLIPFFNLTFNKRDSIRLNNERINLLLMSPDEFRTKVPAMMKRSLEDNEDDLFSSLRNGDSENE